MNSLRALNFAVLLVLTAGACCCAQDSPPPPAQEKPVPLPAGKTPGTFGFSYTGDVRFTQEAAYPTTVTLTDAMHRKIATIPVKDASPFTISCDLAPGSYRIASEVTAANDPRYWESLGPDLFIDNLGKLHVGMRPGGTDLIHEKKLTILAPLPLAGSTVTENRPLLKWQALPGAANYRVSWLEEDAPYHVVRRGEGNTAAAEFRLTEDAIPNRQYEWSVWASDANGAELGYWSAAYFFTPGGVDAFHKKPEVRSATKGMPYVGITPLRLFDRNGVDTTGGILVHAISPDSPAMKAGLLPNDLLISFDGHALANVSRTDFVELVRAVPVGRSVPVEYRRDGVVGKTNVTIEAMP